MRDVDGFGVLWYGNYLVLCDEARSELLRAFDMPPGKFAEWGYAAAVVEVKARYLAPARHDDEVDVHVRIPEASGAKLTFEFTVKRGAEVLVVPCDVTNQEQVCSVVDQATQRFGGVDIVVNNAGIIQVGPMSTTTTEDFVNALDVMAVRRHLSTAPAPVTSPYDFNHDGRVNALDLLIARRALREGATLGAFAPPP